MMATILMSPTLASLISMGPTLKPAEAQQQLPREVRNWEYIGHDEFGTAYNPQNQITPANAQLLEIKWLWTKPLDRVLQGVRPAAGVVQGSVTPPLIVDGIVYFSTNQLTVFALDLGTGKTIWSNFQPVNYSEVQARNAFLPAFQPHIHAMNYYREKNWVIPSTYNCHVTAFNALTGKVELHIPPDKLCGTYDEMRAWGNRGHYFDRGSHPPVITGNLMVVPIMSRTQWGGRAFVAGYDISNPANVKRVWQTFIFPPTGVGGTKIDPEWALHECDKGWFFSEPHWTKDPKVQALKCQDVAAVNRENLLNDWVSPYDDPRFGTLVGKAAIPKTGQRSERADAAVEPSLKGQVHSRSGISQVWGQYVMDPETRTVYIGTGESGWYPNATFHPGPNLYANSIIALNADTGKFVWWFQALPHEIWDWDCSWNLMFGKIGNRKAVWYGCKDGFYRAHDATTGEPIWTIDVTANPGERLGRRCRPTCTQMDPTNKGNPLYGGVPDLKRPWPNYPDTKAFLQWPTYGGAREADMAFDGKNIYGGFRHVSFTCVSYGPLGDLGGPADACGPPRVGNSTFKAIDASTGKIIWENFINELQFRGGVSVCGDLLLAYTQDSMFRVWDKNTGKVLLERLYNNVGMQPTCGATADGKMRIVLQSAGGQGGAANEPGVIFALGLPDKLPEPQVVTKEVVKEVEKVVVKEVPKEVTKTVTVETVSPITYVGVAAGIIIAIVGLVASRRGRKVA